MTVGDPTATSPTGAPVYLAGLRLAGRRVLVAGGGRVALRRLRRLLEADADILVVAPRVLPEISDLALRGIISVEVRPVRPEDVDAAWYVMAATDDAAVNQQLGERCERQRIFCVRSDDAWAGTAWTPAVEQLPGFSVGVVGTRDPRGSVRLLRNLMSGHDPQAGTPAPS